MEGVYTKLLNWHQIKLQIAPVIQQITNDCNEEHKAAHGKKAVYTVHEQ